MTQVLYLTYGSTTIDFQAGGYKLLDPFYPEVPTDPARAEWDDGYTLTERFDIRIDGSDSERVTRLQAIRHAFNYAREHKYGSAGTWLYYGIDEDADVYRARVVEGVAMHRQTIYRDWRHDFVYVSVVLERRAYWEGALAQIPITNTNGTDNTAGLNIYNCNDGSGTSPNDRVNYCEISADDVIGDMPAPAKLVITNNYNVASAMSRIWIGHNHHDPENFVWNYEAEDATLMGGVTPDVDPSASGGYDVEFTLANMTETDIMTFSLTADQLSAAGGQYVHAFLRHSPSSMKFRIRLDWDSVPIWQTDQVIRDYNENLGLLDLFTFRLPPWLENVSDLDTIDLVVTAQRTDYVTSLIGVDFLMLLPADSWRFISAVDAHIDYESRIIDDGPSGEVYRDNGSDEGRVGMLSTWGEGIMLEPGKDQRLYFLTHSRSAGTAEIARSISLKVYYRPRRTSL